MNKLTAAFGVLAMIALAIPDLVVLGFFFFILPGLILMTAPTVFAYLAGACVIRTTLPLGSGVVGTAIAFVGAAAVGALVTLPFQMLDEAEYRTAIKEDFVRSVPLTLSGHVRIERSDLPVSKHDQENICDELCAAMLVIPGIKSVTLARGRNLETVTNWKLVPKENATGTGLAPTEPENIFKHFPDDKANGLGNLTLDKFRKARRKSLAAEWNLRLAIRETLVAADTFPEPDVTIAISHDRDRREPNVHRVEVSDKAGATLLRRSLVTHEVVQSPFYLSFTGTMLQGRFEVGRRLLSTGTKRERFNPVTELLLHIEGLQPTPSSDAPLRVKELLIAALDNPDVASPELALAVPWMNEVESRGTSEADANLVRRIVADLRIADVGESLRRVYSKKVPIEYRSTLVRRISKPETNSGDRKHFADMLASMPVGTFADMTPDEWRLINDPILRDDATPFIERLADLGKAGVDPLLEIMKNAISNRGWHERKATIHAVCRGFARLGTDAIDASPVIQPLLEQKPSPIMNSAQEGFQWRIALARMGVPIDELPYPSSWSERSILRMHETIRRRLANFDPAS